MKGVRSWQKDIKITLESFLNMVMQEVYALVDMKILHQDGYQVIWRSWSVNMLLVRIPMRH